MDALFRRIPAGVGTGGPYLFGGKELRRLLAEGAPYLVSRGWATPGDLEHTEAGGCLPGAEPDCVSQRALQRGGDQCGTLGSGNHFLEVQVVDEMLDEAAARTMGLEKDLVCVMIHSGSRGLGYQVCDDALAALRKAPAKYGIELPDRQLACARSTAPRARQYLGAMRCAANYAWANRQLLMWQTREIFADFFGRSWESLQMNLVYDVAHNIAKMEEHEVEGRPPAAVRASQGGHPGVPAGHPEVPEQYRQIGQPVIIPGDMGRASWVLVGQPGSMERTFGTTCHGAGRVMSRTAAVKHAQGPADRPRTGRKGHHRQVSKLEGPGRGAAGGLQGRQSGGRRGPPRRAGQQSRPAAAGGSGERMKGRRRKGDEWLGPIRLRFAFLLPPFHRGLHRWSGEV